MRQLQLPPGLSVQARRAARPAGSAANCRSPSLQELCRASALGSSPLEGLTQSQRDAPISSELELAEVTHSRGCNATAGSSDGTRDKRPPPPSPPMSHSQRRSKTLMTGRLDGGHIPYAEGGFIHESSH